MLTTTILSLLLAFQIMKQPDCSNLSELRPEGCSSCGCSR
ncbi:hypothetical protein Ptr902_05293 [Pyrenophora tritici-repentis]|uniref:Uncharacterized protein n=1 Tax=Pyrenophora tritici-repentis TaxID=45151 RepID=A0A5M9LHI7_9PLEO|nr:hypothetical protein PtrV1_04294 [Pyrenophora tritici-repentis]KAF7451975.1 hypothetical protein A1F99_037520 [Pyrenophora tritici-repentis]KAF7574902.1 hypothetical protein PtrM4_065260 [Pyrenophora tritici-repentis]KAI0589884.1 hypothetical protein Alg215_00007 [Pyrenophora tritici-repentis]KAI0592337.1 hypothetical protein Alg130_00297 [Pyrenophora tritici-repentis]